MGDTASKPEEAVSPRNFVFKTPLNQGRSRNDIYGEDTIVG